MANAKVAGAKCYGYVTMASVEDAERCIQKLNRSEIDGKTVTVEKANNVSLPGKRSGFRYDESSYHLGGL